MNVTEPLRRLGLLHPDRPALIGHDGTALSYADLDDLIDLVGMEADRRGFAPGDVVGLDIAGLDQFRGLIVALGLARRGIATAAPLAAGLKLRLLAASRHLPPARRDSPDAAPNETLAQFWDGMAAGRGAIMPGPIHPDPAAVFRVFASSGTTGRPRFMSVEHRMITRRVQDRLTSLVPISLVHAPAIPLGIAWGMEQAIRTLWAGGTLVLTHTAAVHDALVRHGVTSIACSPSTLAEILKAMPDDAPPPPALRRIEIGGSVLSPRLRRQAETRLCPMIVNDFGATETSVVASAPLAALDAVPGAVGYLHPGVRAEAVDDNDRALPFGTQGRLRVRSLAPVAGYRFDPAATARHFRDGWFYPGDVGTVREDGLLVVTGRESELINAGGVKVAPGVIEQVLEEWPGVVEAAAFGAPDEDGITRIQAAIAAETILDLPALAVYLNRRLGECAPRGLHQVAALPRNANGKLVRATLTALALRGRA